MRCDSWTAAGTVLAIVAMCAALAACSSSKPPLPDVNPKAALNADCSLAPSGGVGRQMSCQLADALPDTQVDAAHPGSAACGSTSYSVFKQRISTSVRLSYGQKGDDGPLRVRVGGVLGPGTHSGKVGKSAGNDCDATVGPVVNLNTRFGGGSYVAVVDKSQRPACVAQSSLVLGSFEQTLSAPMPVNLASVAREMSSDALQKRLDLEVAIQVNTYLQPSGRPLSEAVVGRNGRCPEGFRTFTGQ